jgi:hypothetical protein
VHDAVTECYYMEISRDGMGVGESLSAHRPPQSVSPQCKVLRTLENSSFFGNALGDRQTVFLQSDTLENT